MHNETSPADVCEASLKKHKDYCIEHAIYPAWPEIVERMIERRNELVCAYDDLYDNLRGHGTSIHIFFDALLCAVCVWDPVSINDTRKSQKRLESLNKRISELAFDLSCCLEKRDQVQNAHPIGSDTHYHIVDVIECAARENGLFQGWVKEELGALHRRFDMKYWPSLSEILSELSGNADDKNVHIHDQVTAAALKSNRPSKADFCRALLKRVAICIGPNEGELPLSFHLKDESWASMINCVLDLSESELVDGPYVKNLRHRSQDI